MTDTKSRGPIEVWLTQRNMEVTCRAFNEDETEALTDYNLSIDSLLMRGAQREITAWLMGMGYVPVGRWETDRWMTEDNGASGPSESSRKFKPTKLHLEPSEPAPHAPAT